MRILFFKYTVAVTQSYVKISLNCVTSERLVFRPRLSKGSNHNQMDHDRFPLKPESPSKNKINLVNICRACVTGQKVLVGLYGCRVTVRVVDNIATTLFGILVQRLVTPSPRGVVSR